MKVPAAELVTRLRKFTYLMNINYEGWRFAFIFNPVTAYYFTGTMQDGVLFIQRDEIPIYFVKRSYDRAKDESRFSEIVQMHSYSYIAEKLALNKYSKVYIDKQFVTMDIFSKFNKYFEFENIESCDFEISKTMSVKSSFELNMIRRAGEIQRQVLEEYLPQIIRAGMTEAELSSFLVSELLNNGVQPVSRLSSYGRELFLGNISFGANSLKRTSLDSPFGTDGNCPAVPFLASPHKILERDEMVYIDSYCGIEGYSTGMSAIYGSSKITDYVYEQQRRCAYIRDRVVEMLKPGITPESIYEYFINTLHPALEGVFMGILGNQSEYLGKGIGLYIDEYPFIAKGFKEPLKENMVITVEPKVAVKGVGTIGVKNTYIVTANGGESVNGDNSEIINLVF